jgi:hypothetical protein
MAKKILALAFLFFPLLLSAQSIKDTCLSLNMFSFHVSGHIPAGDIGQRYGLNAGVGGSYWFKTKTNWLMAADFTYIFGENIKEDSVLDGLKDKAGFFITNNGSQMYPTISERGFYAGLRLGKVFPVFGPNPNSGLMVTASAGLLQYKTFYRLEENSIPVLADNYTKMIDYLTNGFAMEQFIGYLHLDNKEPINFYAGFEFHEAWTMGRRDWLYNLQGPDNKARRDFLFGIRIGWIFPVGKKTTGTYTYF